MSDIKFLTVAFIIGCGTVVYLINSTGPNQTSNSQSPSISISKDRQVSPTQSANNQGSSTLSSQDQPSSSNINNASGWIWLGSVNNSSGTFSYGEPLIPSQRQPVTVTPSVVPSPGEVVTLKTDVNVRSNLPQPPDFELQPRIGEPFTTGQQVVILRVEAYVNPKSEIPNTRIWAKIKSN